jgi:hypothetical protein
MDKYELIPYLITGAGALAGMTTDVVADRLIALHAPDQRMLIPGLLGGCDVVVYGVFGVMALAGYFLKKKKVFAFGLGGVLAELGQTIGEQLVGIGIVGQKPFNVDWQFPSTNVIHGRPTPEYATQQRMPFQTDLTW